MIRLRCPLRVKRAMKKAFVAVLSAVILVQAPFFAFRSDAYSVSSSWTRGGDSYSGTVSLSYSNSYYIVPMNMSQYITNWTDVEYSGVSTGSSSYSKWIISPEFYIGGYCYVYWDLSPIFSLPSSLSLSSVEFYIRNCALSYGSFSGLSLGYPVFLLGTDSEVLSGTAPVVNGSTTSSIRFYDPDAVGFVRFWLRGIIFYDGSTPSVSINNVSVSYNDWFYRFFGTDDAINQSLLDINSSVSSQTSSINNKIDSQTNSINNQIAQKTEEQTEDLTNGYDNSQIVNANTQLAGSMDDYEAMESQVSDQAGGYIQNVEFFDPTANTSIMSGITLTGSFLQSLYANMHDWSAVILVSLSLTFALMLIGWFKFRR